MYTYHFAHNLLGRVKLKFVWFAMAQCGVTVPSITQVKNFKLPGLVPPIRVRQEQ